MFEIHPAAADKAAVLAAREGVIGNVSAMILWDRGEESGYALYELQNDTVQLLVFRSADADLQEWLVRAVLNAAANRDAVTAVCFERSYFPLLEKLGFTVENGSASVSIPDVFNRPCAGCAGGC